MKTIYSDSELLFRTRYSRKYDPEKNYVIMDDSSITEQSGYRTTEQLVEEMTRSGRVLRAHLMDMSVDQLLEHEENQESYETYYELDPVEQQEIMDNYLARLQITKDEIENEKSKESNQKGTSENSGKTEGTESNQTTKTLPEEQK